jgi:carbohydrate-binding DOMON domain-containing protein
MRLRTGAGIVRGMRPTALSVALALLFVLGILAGCGGGGDQTAALTGISAPTRNGSLPERTVTETTPAQTVTTQETRTAIVARTSTAVLTQSVTTTATTTGVSAAAAAAAGAAVATQEEDSSSTQWGWVAFGILTLGVIVFAIVWWIRRRHAAKPAT